MTTSAAAIAALAMSGLAMAQQPPSSGAAAQAPVQLEEVTVTGSRIKRTTDFTTPTPTTVIDTETMQNLGIVNVGQALQLTPSNVSEFTPQTTGSSPFYTGAYIPDLRGLNGFFSTRTLTLIDGRRAPPTNTSDSFDLNFIPQILVQRVDTVTGGGSAAYGSGAVAGVVNIILNRHLEGGRLDADWYTTHYNDARDQHVSAAFGHGWFNDRLHVVIGGEYEKQDAASCMASGRPWCVRNFGPYNTQYGPTGTALTSLGSNLRTDAVSQSGVLGAAALNPATFSYTGTAAGSPLYEASQDGTSLLGYEGNNAVYGGNATGIGGAGNPLNLYTNLLTPVTRGVITAMFTGKITDHMNLDVDLNWGKVEANNPDAGQNTQYAVLGLDNPFLSAFNSVNPNGTVNTAASLINPASGYYLGKDWNAQIPNSEYNDTSLKHITVDLNGQIGDSSWTYDGYYEYGLTENVEGEPTDFHADASSMALDSVSGPNGPECRITAALAAHPGNLDAAFADLLGQAATAYPAAGPFGSFSYPAYLRAVYSTGVLNGVNVPADPLTGLGLLQQEALLAQNCVPLNPFGKAQLTSNEINYATGNLSLRLRETQTVVALNATGDYFHGIGAGPFSIAAGYSWRQEVTHNDFANCPPGMPASDYQVCLAQTTDYTVQFGNMYGGDMDVNEGYLELDFPLLKNRRFARMLDLDVAGRVSSYDNTALYALGIPTGSSGTATFPTWKATLNFEPVQGVRLRATESRDERAPDPRDLYYSQTFVAGSAFGSCGSAVNPFESVPCNINLIGNVNLKPESANTTTVGIVLTPPQLPGFEFSADWYHIHLINGINGGNYNTVEVACATGHGAAACPGITFNPYSYNAAGLPCSSGVSGPLAPSGVACNGPALTGAAAYQQAASAANIIGVDAPAYNGAFYDTRGIDFSLNYVFALPDDSTLAVRALTTWVGSQIYQPYVGGPIVRLLGQTGGNTSFIGLGDFQNDPRWRGNISITWAKGPWSITPNLTWIGQGTLNANGLECSQADLTNPSNPCEWVYDGYPQASTNPTQAYYKELGSYGLGILPMGVKNHVPAYFLTGLNVTYNFANVLQGLQLYTQINNLFNKAPPFAASSATAGGFNGSATTTNAVFFDQLGLSYRVGFRLAF